MASNPSGCQEKIGFVILHKCGLQADAQCNGCGKYLCRKHSHIHAGVPVCESCLKKSAPEEYQKAVSSRPAYAHYYGYRPYYYQHYSSSDHELFSRSGSEGFHESGEGS